jgi:predicted kinase
MSTLYVMVGLSGTGKSTAAEIIAKNTGAEIHKTDRIRKEITEDEPTYSREESQRVYDTLLSRGGENLSDEQDSVLDATFTLEMGRKRAENVAQEHNAEILFVKVTCDESVVKDRLRNRTNSDSDAGVEVYESQKESFEEMNREYVELDNSGTQDDLQKQVEEHVL